MDGRKYSNCSINRYISIGIWKKGLTILLKLPSTMEFEEGVNCSTFPSTMEEGIDSSTYTSIGTWKE